MNPKVTIILPSYNHARFLNDRLQSIANQTYHDWEMIVIDDNSTDESQEILKAFIRNYPQKIKHFICNPTNSGSGYKSWQKGIALAQTEYIWIAETDDYCEVNFLQEMVAVLENNQEAALAICNSNYVDSNREFLYDSTKRTSILKVEKNTSKIFDGLVLLDSMPFSPLITNGSSVVFRKPKNPIPDNVFQYKQMSDLFLWTFLAKNNTFVFLNSNLNFFRRHEDSTTTKIGITQCEILYKEFVAYLNCYPDKQKEAFLFEKFIKEYWILQFRKGKNSLAPLKGLKNNNFFILRIKFMQHFFRFALSKL